MLLTSVFLHFLHFIDPRYEKRQITFPELLQCILRIRKAQLHVSDHQEMLSMHKRTRFPPSCNQSLQNSASIRYLPEDIYIREHCNARSLPEQVLMVPIFVQRGEMSQARLTLVCLWISDMYYLISIKITQA